MSTERDQAIEKIKKLLRMKRGGTIHEIETALALAQEIARKHGIDITSVNPEEEEQLRPIGHDDALRSARLQWEVKYAGLICEAFFNVEVFARQLAWKKLALTFVGTEWDRQVAVYVFRFLVGHFRREWEEKRGRCRNRRAFMWGIYNGLSAKLSKAIPNPPGVEGLILVSRAIDRRRNYIEKHFGKMKSSSAAPDHGADQSYYRGYLAGQATNIRPAVESGQPKPKEIGL